MTSWTTHELHDIGEAEELQLASRRPDGTLRNYVTIWTVRVGESIYVRSGYGAKNPWYVRAVESGTGRISAGGVEKDVAFDTSIPDAAGEIDAAYHAKYDRFGEKIVSSVAGEGTHVATLRILPQLTS